jgi:hypothetical protein
MKRNKRASVFFMRLIGAIFALVCVFSFIPAAHAEEARILITANPTELTDAGNVTFTFEINNYNADYPMTDILINYNNTDYHVLDGIVIAPSSQINNISLNLPVSQSQLGKPITFLVKWTRNGEPMSQTAQYTVAQAENPTISVTRTADKTNAKPGDTIKITYTLKNETKYDMSNIMLIDENISDNAILELPKLLAGATYSPRPYEYVMGEESAVSSPLVTYTVNGRTKSFSSLEPLELTMVLIRLDMRVKAGMPTSTGVTFTLDITNSGTQAISNIAITDERANPVNDTPFALAPGESRSLSYIVVPLMTEPLRNVQFQLTGVDPFAQPYQLAPADIYEVYPYVDSSQINVTVRAETITPWTQESGRVSARITITNHSSVELTDITVSETTIGVIKNYDILLVGETTFDQEIQLGSPRNLNITVKGYDPTGANRALASCVMPVAYGTETAAPASPTPVQTDAGGVRIFSGLSNGIATILIILGVLMVLSVIVLVALTAMERARAPHVSLEEEEDDFFDEKRTQHTSRTHYHDKPDPDEIRYTQRMFSVREPEGPPVQQEPIRLPAPPVRPSDQPPVIFAQPPRPPEPEQPRMDELAHRLVETARTRYTDAQSAAVYRPVEQAAPVAPQKETASTPRVFDYKKQPKAQPATKPSVTRVQRSGFAQTDDEEE